VLWISTWMHFMNWAPRKTSASPALGKITTS
jgi:hypothetical protein